MKKAMYFLICILLVSSSYAKVVGQIVNNNIQLMITAPELEQEINNSLGNSGWADIHLIQMNIDYDVNNPAIVPYFEFKFSYKIPNDLNTYYLSVARECALNPNNNEIEPLALGAGTKVVCNAKNCGDGCKAKRTGCTSCQPPPIEERTGNGETKCEPQTEHTPSGIGQELLTGVVSAILTWLGTHCC